MKKRPFEGVNILDFTWTGTGPFTVNYLAFFGASVIKVESHRRPDALRALGPFKDGVPGPENSYFFSYTHVAKKYNISLNLSHPRGVEIVRKLVRSWANVVVDSYSAGALEKWGLDYENLKQIKPDIIMLRTCIHGHTGPLASHHGQGFVLTALSGFDAITGWPDRPPSGVYSAFTDYVAPQLNAIALMAALDRRRRTGQGQYIDQSQHEAVMQLISPLLLDYTANHRDVKTDGNHLAYASPHAVYRCQGDDRWCAIAVFTDKEWESCCRVIGIPELSEDPRFKTFADRKKNEAELDRLIEAWTNQYTSEEVMRLMQSSGVAAGIVSNGKDQAEDPQLNHYHFFESVEHPIMGNIPFCHGPCFRLSKTPYELGRATLIGEHNEYVYSEILGMSEEEMAKLDAEGIFT
jgi:benzylsuccinate CoA-transferase BbsF subunit